MPRSRKPDFVPPDAVDRVAAVLAGFDYGVDPDDFILYELARRIEEDSASFEDAEFRRLIDDGIRTHVENDPAIRAQLAGRLRAAARTMDSGARTVAARVVRALEGDGPSLANSGTIVRSYTSYLFDRLETAEDAAADAEAARQWIEQWRSGAIAADALAAKLHAIGRAAAGAAADLLFDDPDDVRSAATAVAILAGIRTPLSARVLAHAISEPMLDEAVEAAAAAAVRGMWPLARTYVLQTLERHAHEDLPFRWFQLLVDMQEPAAVDRILEELRFHGDNADFHEDLAAALDALLQSRDPETEDRIVDAINSDEISASVKPLLESFLREYKPAARPDGDADPWARRALQQELQRRYVAAAALFDAGRIEEAGVALDRILAADPEHPFASMLKSLTRH